MHLNITIAATQSSQCSPPPSQHPVYLPRSHRQPPLWKCQLRTACFSSLVRPGSAMPWRWNFLYSLTIKTELLFTAHRLCSGAKHRPIPNSHFPRCWIFPFRDSHDYTFLGDWMDAWPAPQCMTLIKQMHGKIPSERLRACIVNADGLYGPHILQHTLCLSKTWLFTSASAVMSDKGCTSLKSLS